MYMLLVLLPIICSHWKRYNKYSKSIEPLVKALISQYLYNPGS